MNGTVLCVEVSLHAMLDQRYSINNLSTLSLDGVGTRVITHFYRLWDAYKPPISEQSPISTNILANETKETQDTGYNRLVIASMTSYDRKRESRVPWVIRTRCVIVPSG